MISLIRNEHVKIVLKKGSLVLALALAAGCLAMAVLTKRMLAGAGVDENFIGFLSLSTTLLGVLPFFVIPIAGASVASEFELGTIKFLLIRPARRTKILLSKYVTVLLFCVYFLLYYLVLSIILGSLLFGFNGIADSLSMLRGISIDYTVCLIEMVMMTSFAFMISAVFRSSSLAGGLTIIVILAAKSLVGLLAHYNVWWGKFLLFSNTDFSQYMNGNEPLFEGTGIFFSIFILCAHLVSFIGFAWFVFIKRDVAN